MRKVVIIILGAFILLSSFSIAQKVSNVHFEQVGKKIHIYYDLEAYQPFIIKVYCSTDNGKFFGEPLHHITGDKGMGQINGKNKKIIWDVQSEIGVFEGDLQFKVVSDKQPYIGNIPRSPEDNINEFCEYTPKVLIPQEYLDADTSEYVSWYGENKVNYGIITDVVTEANFATIHILVLKTNDKLFRTIDGENWKVYLSYNEIERENEIKRECFNGLRSLIVPGRRVAFSMVESCPNCGTSMNGVWSLSYIKAMDNYAFNEKANLMYNEEYFTNSYITPDYLLSDSVKLRIDYLLSMDGQYPHDVFFFDDIIIKKRTKHLLGVRYSFIIESWGPEVPIKVKNDIFIASACQANNCNWTSFIIVIDLKENLMHIGVEEERKVKIYSENKSKLPQEMLDWKNKKTNR